MSRRSDASDSADEVLRKSLWLRHPTLAKIGWWLRVGINPPRDPWCPVCGERLSLVTCYGRRYKIVLADQAPLTWPRNAGLYGRSAIPPRCGGDPWWHETCSAPPPSWLDVSDLRRR